MSEIDELKQEIIKQLDIKGYYEKHLNGQVLKDGSNGWSDRVLCPIHEDANAPNFFVNTQTGGFHCHACGASGSVFDFWILKNGLSVEDRRNFWDAVVAIANEAGVDVAEYEKKHKGRSTTPRPHDANKTREPETFIPKVNKADAHDALTAAIPEKLLEKYQHALTADHIKFLNQQRGLSKKTIDEWKLGWNIEIGGKTTEGQHFSGRYVIPVRCKKGLIRNLRFYSEKSPPEFKILNLSPHGSPARLLGLDRLIKEGWDHVVICEGELDCILLNQELKKMGLTSWGAVTGTHGAKTFLPEWLEFLFGKHVYFCFDADDPGKTAMESHVSKHFTKPMRAGKFLDVKLITLPLDGSKETKDITDYFVKANFDIEQFIKLVNETVPLLVGGVAHDEATVEAEEVSDFIVALKDRNYIDKRITVPLTISGQSNRTYHAIRSYRVTGCPLLNPHGKSKGTCCSIDCGESIVPYGNELFILSCMANKGIVLKELSRIACQNGQPCVVEPIHKVVMEEYFAHQVIHRWRAEEGAEGKMQNVQELVQASIYVLQPATNFQIGPQNYMATGWVRTDPRTQGATLFVESLMPMDDDWKKFTLEREDCRQAIQELKDDWTVDQITASLTEHVTQIYETDDVLYAILLTYLSPIMINFNGSTMRGWLNTAIIGDSGTGKSATYSKISDWLDLGDLFSVLSGTRTGLLYAIKQKAGEWHVSIGRYVQASGKIIAIDETQETTAEEIKRMAIAMDKGWLEVSQVASGGYQTQTRTIFMMNPKLNGKAKTISDFSHGCEALKECFDPMFIRRIDLAVFTSNQHNYSFYNQPKVGRESEVRAIPVRLFKSLIHWAWTRNVSNIIWTNEATVSCLSSATELSEAYGHADDIPLICPQDFRNNLARMSTAYAILDRNFTPDLENVTVEERHVKAMARLVDQIYSGPSCNLRQRSKHSKRRNTLDDYEKIKGHFEQIIDHSKTTKSAYYRSQNHFCQMLLLLQQLEYIRKRDLQEQLSVSLTWVQKRVAILQAFNLLEVDQAGYKTTRKFNLFLQRWQKEEGVEEMLDSVHQSLGHAASISSMIDDEFTDERAKYNEEAGTEDPFNS